MNKYKDMFNKKYICIYILYFFVFLALGGMNTLIALELKNDGGSVFYGYFLTITTLIEIILPSISSTLTNLIGARNTTVLYFGAAMICAICAIFVNKISILIIVFLIISSSRTIFNFSCGSELIFKIEDNEKGKFFAIRDLFLYSGIAIGLLAASFAVNHIEVKYVITIFTLLLCLPMIEIIFLGKSIGLEKKKRINEDSKKIFMLEQIRLNREIFRHREFILFLIIGILTSVYSSCSSFLPFLASEKGLDYQEILTLFSGITTLNVIIALFISGFSDRKNKKILYLVDLGSDFIPVIIYAFGNNVYLFCIAVLLSSFKDIFAPTTFAYKYEVFGKFESELSQTAIASLESFTNLFCFMMPVIVGILWENVGAKIFYIAAVCIVLSVVVGLFLPKSNVNIYNQ